MVSDPEESQRANALDSVTRHVKSCYWLWEILSKAERSTKKTSSSESLDLGRIKHFAVHSRTTCAFEVLRSTNGRRTCLGSRQRELLSGPLRRAVNRRLIDRVRVSENVPVQSGRQGSGRHQVLIKYEGEKPTDEC